MLNFILQQAQRFEHRHGMQPNVVYMNEVHFQALAAELPGLFCDKPEIELGFNIAILANQSISHPQVALIETRKEVKLHPAMAHFQSSGH